MPRPLSLGFRQRDFGTIHEFIRPHHTATTESDTDREVGDDEMPVAFDRRFESLDHRASKSLRQLLVAFRRLPVDDQQCECFAAEAEQAGVANATQPNSSLSQHLVGNAVPIGGADLAQPLYAHDQPTYP